MGDGLFTAMSRMLWETTISKSTYIYGLVVTASSSKISLLLLSIGRLTISKVMCLEPLVVGGFLLHIILFWEYYQAERL